VLDCGGSLAPLSEELIKLCHIISPNETEREGLIGKKDESEHMEHLLQFVQTNKNVTLLLKEGASGATLLDCKSHLHQDAFRAHGEFNIIDTTGAGDTFTAAYTISNDLRFA
jgi:ribokinase